MNKQIKSGLLSCVIFHVPEGLQVTQLRGHLSIFRHARGQCVGQGCMIFPVEVPLAYGSSPLEHTAPAFLCDCVLEWWGICQSPELFNVLFLACLLREKSTALRFAPLGIQFSSHLKLFSLVQTAMG